MKNTKKILLYIYSIYSRLQDKGYPRPSYLFETGSEPLLPLTMGQLIEWAAEEYADKEALVSVNENVRWTFKEAKEKADQLAAGFLALGLNPGDVIALWGFNSSYFYQTALAAARAGLILAKVDPSSQAPELHHCLNKVGAKLLVAAETDVTQNYYKIIHSLAPELNHCAAGQLRSEQLPELRIVVMTGDLTHPCTAIMGTPAMFVDVVTAVKELGVTISGLEIAMIGGTVIPELLARQITKVLAIKRLCPVYGMTEGLYFFVGVPETSLEETFTTVGKAMQHVEFKAVDKEGKMVPMGSPGELWVRGYIVMLGYWGDEAKTRETITADGWLKTGDQVILLENGHCRIVGRIKEAIIRGSDNIFPKEIEDLFINHPDIVDAQAFGVPDARWGEEICLYIRPRKGSDVTEECMKAYCKGKLANTLVVLSLTAEDGEIEVRISVGLQGMGYPRPSYWFETGSEPLLPLTLGQLIEWAAEEYADKEALVSVYENVRWTFKEAKEKADRLAAGFLALGLNPGDVIALWGFNSSYFYHTSLAAARAGLILAKIDPSYQAPELRHCLNKVGAKLLVAAETDVTQNYYKIVHSLAPELDHCAAGQLRSDQLPELRTVVMTGDLTHPSTYNLDDLITMATPEGIARLLEIQKSIQPDDGTAIHYTSGTTGSPKGALLSHRNIINAAYWFVRQTGMKKSYNFCAQMQCCHVGTSIAGIVAGLHVGFTLVFPSPKFNPESSIEAIIQERCSAVFGTPAMFVDLVAKVRELGITINNIEIVFIGGSMIPEVLARQIIKVLATKRFCPVYGMTEGVPLFLSVPEDSLEQTLTTVGKAVKYAEFKVVDKEGKMVPMGSPGELWVRGYIVMLGYWGDEAKTRETITADGWLKTGDQVILLESGHCKVVGRIKEAIIRGSDNVFPKEIEEFFLSHPDVVDAQAFGVPDARWGEEMCLYIRPKEGRSLTEEHMKTFCKGKVAEFRIPRYVRFLDDFPRNTTGKVDKKKLKEQFLQDKEFKEFNEQILKKTYGP
uniref:Medium-chain acyl-CoA ligase ACSF2, mitochondrial n=1 Tax=Timema genevievae TaxID=629358 RepID=A0A7R9PLY4_TIMGE|nr:unnamed protein product [Timema genevievae]